MSELPTERRYATGGCLSSAVTAFEKHKIYNKGLLRRSKPIPGSQDKARDAVVPAQRAVSLANQGQDIVARFRSELVDGEVKAALHSFQEAENILEHLRTEAIHRGYLSYGFKADLCFGKVQMKSSNAVPA